MDWTFPQHLNTTTTNYQQHWEPQRYIELIEKMKRNLKKETKVEIMVSTDRKNPHP